MVSVTLEPSSRVAVLGMERNNAACINGARSHVPTHRNHTFPLRRPGNSSTLTVMRIDFAANGRTPLERNHWRQVTPWNCRNVARNSDGGILSSPNDVASPPTSLVPQPDLQVGDEDRVKQLFWVADFEEALVSARNKLVVIEFAASHSANSAKIYPAMVDLSRRERDVEFYIIMGDLSEDMASLCARFKIRKVPYFLFFKGGKLVHEEEGLDSERLRGDVLYYGDNDAPVQQLRSSDDVEALLQRHATDHRLVVVDVSLKHCGPCVNVYPTVVKLANNMVDTAVFARMFGDENDSCKALLKKMNVKEVPCFIFMRDGKLLGRYVGSGKGELIGEVLRHQGVRVTY